MIIKINLKNDLKIGDIIPVEDLARKFERDLLPLAILQKIDDDGFELTIEDFENLSFDNSGRYFENKESSLKQINKAIEDILMGKDISPVIIDTKGNVVDGQHRMCAFKILGIKDIPVLKSLMNETIFDNFMTRSKKLGIPLLEDFYTEFDLLENKTYQFYKNKSDNFIDNINPKDDNIQIIKNRKKLKF